LRLKLRNNIMTTQTIKELREKTGAGIMNCKRALEEAKGDIDGAVEILKRQGLAKAEKNAHREARQGLIETYIHTGGRIGALLEVNCETDFVARTNEFRELAHHLAMQVAATAPVFLSRDDFSEKELPDEVDPDEVDPDEVCLLSQPFIRDPERTVQDIITETVARVGENIKVRRFARFELGKD
jgi:elongation factor Ts